MEIRKDINIQIKVYDDELETLKRAAHTLTALSVQLASAVEKENKQNNKCHVTLTHELEEALHTLTHQADLFKFVVDNINGKVE